MLAIQNTDTEQLSVIDNQMVISQLFLKNVEQVPKAVQIIYLFSKASGLQLNLKKMWTISHSWPPSCETTVKYLGVHVRKDKLSETLNTWNTSINQFYL